ncbi:hypothetical protein [Kineobactrum salinum]|uniref:Sulphur transport domain-containing protein n=1 Tax=Kineobactrum salinum TaxID=2708301 RepID=A0A6C0TYU3_9GAMM|nr:hypothetical protein [Kineobactrum salinum]QIB64990.1 hypothetical protein G3T16_05830 [Kineobactrum salinum]
MNDQKLTPRISAPPLCSGLAGGGLIAIVAVTMSSLVSDSANDAYGICMACHGRDLLGWLLNSWLGLKLHISSQFTFYPAMTSLGVLVGAHFSARLRAEYRRHRSAGLIKPFILGTAVMVSALIAGGCATRLALRVAAFDITGATAFVAMTVAVALTTLAVRWWAMR